MTTFAPTVMRYVAMERRTAVGDSC